MTNTTEIIEKSNEIYKGLSKTLDSYEEIVMVLELAKDQASRGASLSDIQNGYHLEQDIESE